MVIYTGIGSAIGFTEEATFNEAAGTSALIETPDFKGGMESLDASKEILYPEYLASSGRRGADISVLSESVSGGVTLDPRWDGKSWWMILSHLCGQYSSKSADGSQFKHTMNFGSQSPDESAKPNTVGIQATVDRGATTGATCYRGLKPISSEFTWAFDQTLSMANDFMGCEASAVGPVTFTAAASTNPLMVSPYTSATQFLQWNSTGYNCASSSIKFERPRIAVNDISTAVAKSLTPDGFFKCSGSFEIFALDDASVSAFDVLMQDYRAQTRREIILTVAGANSNDFVITVPSATITTAPTNHVDGAGAQKVTIEWEACVEASAYLAGIVLTNDNDLAKGFRA